MKDEYLLSICIPTYNRRERLKALVQEITKYNDSRVQVVISDNNSDDGTREWLNSINNKHVKKVMLTKLETAFYNMINSIRSCDGKYILYCNDRDNVNMKKCLELIDFLQMESYSFLYCDKQNKNKVLTYENNCKGAKKILYNNYHPSGCLFKRDSINLENLELYSSRDVVGFFPHDFIVADVFYKGKVGVYSKGVISVVDMEFKKKNKSGTSSNEWFLPIGRKLQLVRYMRHFIKNSQFNDVQKRKILNNLLMKQIREATFIYEYFITNEHECEHYGLKTKENIKTKEILKITHSLINAYFDELEKANNKLFLKKSETYLFILLHYNTYVIFPIIIKRVKKYLKKIYKR